MSLHTLANHLQTAGRGDDKMLVHMTPGEVNGLQSLAMAHGGSLTINPETGLPEAGFLSSILPMIAGAGLMMVPGMQPLAASMIVGAGGAVATGSLSKGLMMGLGAYGGAGLGASLGLGSAASGASALGSVGASAAGMAPMVSAGAMPGVVGGMGAMAPAAGGMTGTLASATPGLTAATTGAGYANVPTTQLPINTANAGNAFMPTTTGGSVVATTPQTIAAPASSVGEATSNWDKIKSMPGKAYDLLSGSGPEAEKAREEFYKQNKKYLIAGGIGALGSYRDDPRIPKEEKMGPVHSYDYNRRWNPSELAPGSSSERMYFGAEGGLAGLPVEQMSQENSVGENTNYPMANSKPYGYSVPKNNPISQNVFQPESYERLDPYTGEQKLASGGVVALKAGTPAPPKLTPQEKARQDEETNFNKTIKSYYDFGAVKEPKGGWTPANAVSTLTPGLQKELKDLQYVEGRLVNYVDAKGNPKPGYDDVVNYLRDQINDQRGQLQNAINDVYDKIPRTDIDYGDPKKAGTQKTNQLAEYNAVNALLPYINKSSLKGTDFGNDFANNKLAQELNQRNESALYTDKLAPAIAKLQDFTGKNALGKDITGGLSALTTGWNAETLRQKGDVDTLTNAFIAAGLMDAKGNWTPAAEKYSGLTNLAKSALDTQTDQYTDALGAKTSALKDFSSSTARGETIGVHGVSAVPIAPVEPGKEKMGPDASGRIVPIVPKPEYQKLGYGKVSAITGWDNTTRKPYEENDIQQVYQEVLGRKAVDSEVQQWLGNPWKGQPGTMQQLVNAVAANPDAKVVRDPFTADEIKSTAKFYLGKDLSSGELKAISDKKFTTFEGLRNYLTADPTFNKQYVDNLNKINAASFYGTPLDTATKTDTTKTDTTKTDTTKTADGIVPKVNDGFIEDPYGKIMTASDISKYKQQYGGYIPLTSDMTAAGGKQAEPTEEEKKQMAERAQRLYNPQYVASPLYSVPGAMAYQDVNKQLGTSNLYEEMSKKMPDLQSGLKFEASKAVIAANPFANTTPGMVTLQSAAVPQPYVPPSPIVSKQQTYSPALTPEEQALLASLQKQPQTMASGGMTSYNLGGYSDGGRLLKGPGDGVSDSIPASIGNRQPARLADGEFVIPARIVSEIGNGSTDAGARKLYAMMQRVQQARSKTVGRNKVAVKSGADRMLPA
jgi:hypothetical protein